MAEPSEIVEALDALLSVKRDFEGVRVLVTAGPTVEKIDPVRFITNRSSGKMGYALAEAAQMRGAEVQLVSGPVNLAAPAGVQVVPIESSADLCAAVLDRGEWADVVIQAAAPADFRPARIAEQKIKKTGEGMTLALENTTDIAAELGRRKRPGQVLVAFAAETDDVLKNARGKLEKKNADLVVANDVSRSDAGFGVDTNAVTLITREGQQALPLMRKRDVADGILDAVAALMGRER
jgi:phosphopantothenoylcysteine decarboxylase/phosphopantothenate--cysteine ligase